MKSIIDRINEISDEVAELIEELDDVIEENRVLSERIAQLEDEAKSHVCRS